VPADHAGGQNITETLTKKETKGEIRNTVLEKKL